MIAYKIRPNTHDRLIALAYRIKEILKRPRSREQRREDKLARKMMRSHPHLSPSQAYALIEASKLR